MRSAPGLVRQAVAAGITDATSVATGRVRLVPCSWSNVVHRLDVDGQPVAFVKQDGEAALMDADPAVARESVALRMLRTGPLTPSLPRVLADGDALWTQACPGQPLIDVLPQDPVALSARLGQLLARLHRQPVQAEGSGTPMPCTPLPVAPQPWPLLAHLPPSLAQTPPESLPGQVLARRLAPTEAAVLRHTSRQWRNDAWIHGDLSCTNVLVHGDDLVLLDLEHAGLGDPSWDLAAAVGSLTTTLGALAPDLLEASLTSLWTAYLQAGGPGRSDPGLELAHALCQDYRTAAVGYRRLIGAAVQPGAPV